MELEEFLKSKSALKERDEVAPFFKERRHLCAALGLLTNNVIRADRVASELDLFGEFVCDAASGDSEEKTYTLIEFEDAKEFSVLSKLPPGKVDKALVW